MPYLELEIVVESCPEHPDALHVEVKHEGRLLFFRHAPTSAWAHAQSFIARKAAMDPSPDWPQQALQAGLAHLQQQLRSPPPHTDKHTIAIAKSCILVNALQDHIDGSSIATAKPTLH